MHLILTILAGNVILIAILVGVFLGEAYRRRRQRHRAITQASYMQAIRTIAATDLQDRFTRASKYK